MKKIVMSAIAMSFAATVANAGIVSVNESSRANIIKFCEAGSERHCSGLIGDTVYTVINGAILELGTARDFAGKTKDAVKADITKTIVETVVVPQIKTVIKTKIETVEVVKTEVVEKIVEVSQSGDLAEIARLGQQVAHLDGLVEGLEEQLDDANDVIDRLAHELTDIRATEADRTGMLDGSVNQALDLGINGVGYELTGAGYAANNERGREFTRAVFAAGEYAGYDQAIVEIEEDLNSTHQYAQGLSDDSILNSARHIYAQSSWVGTPGTSRYETSMARIADGWVRIGDYIYRDYQGQQHVFRGDGFDASHTGSDVIDGAAYAGTSRGESFIFAGFSNRRDLAADGAHGLHLTSEYVMLGTVLGADVLTDIKELIDASVEAAYDVGYSHGYEDGYNAGYADGFRDGVAWATGNN